MKHFTRLAILLTAAPLLHACVVDEAWKERDCKVSVPTTSKLYREDDTNAAFYAFRGALVSAGYDLDTQDLQAGYLVGRIFEDQCRPPSSWSSDSEAACDSEWPLDRNASATISIDPQGDGVVAVRIRLKDEYTFEDGHTASDLCGEDFEAIFHDAELSSRIEEL
jgi:hypothetical protein